MLLPGSGWLPRPYHAGEGRKELLELLGQRHAVADHFLVVSLMFLLGVSRLSLPGISPSHSGITMLIIGTGYLKQNGL